MAAGELAVNVTARTRKATQNISNFRKSVTSLRSPVNEASKSLKRLAVGLAGVVAAKASLNSLQQTADRIDSIGKTADKLGIATEKLSGLRLAAEETGNSARSLDTSLQRMVRRISEAAKGTGEAKDAIKELGLNAQLLSRMRPDEQFRSIADAMGKVSGQGDKVRLAMKLFDSEGVGLVNTLKLGRKGLDATQDAARRLGLTLNRGLVSQVEKMRDAFGRFKMAFEGFKRQFIVQIAPIITAGLKRITDFFSSHDRIRKWATSLAGGVRLIAGTMIDAAQRMREGFLQMRVDALEVASAIQASLGNHDRAVQLTLRRGDAAADLKAARNEPRWVNRFEQFMERSLKGFEVTKPKPKRPTLPNFDAEIGKAIERIGKAIGGKIANGPNFGALAVAGMKRAMEAMPKGGQQSPVHGFRMTEAGTVESYEQRQRIGRQGAMETIAKKQLAGIKRVADGVERLARGNVNMAPANLGG